jgi:outer membrane protein
MWMQMLFVTLLMAAPAPQDGPRKLTVTDAINAALESNADIEIAGEAEKQTAAKAREQRSELLPNITGTAGYSNQTINLGARGLQFPGIPSKVGPFGTSDLRLQFSEPVVDVSLLRRYRAVKGAAATSKSETEAVRNRVAAMVATLYFNAQRARAMVESVKAQMDLDEHLLKLAQDRKDAGVGTGLDVTRAMTRLAVERQHLIEAENDVHTADLRLLRAMGEPPQMRFTLDDSVASDAEPAANTDLAVREALDSRPELQAEENMVHVARMNVSSSESERLPSLRAFADYGNNGNPSLFIPTNSVGVQLSIPLFDGGLRSAHRASAQSQARQAETRRRDVRDEIEVEVRVAIDNLRSAHEQLTAADQGLKLAEEEMELARLRFESHVTTQIDVIEAQAQLADARTRRVNAVYGVKSSEVEYRRATGTAASQKQ